MVKVTDKNYYMDGYLVKNLNFLCHRVEKKHDGVLILDGDERAGKSTLGKAIGYYIAWKLGRKFTADDILFDIDKLFELFRTTRNKVFVWDESALGGLGQDFAEKAQKLLIQMLMTAGKYNHVLVCIVPKFRTLRRYIADDRSLALIRVYLKNNIDRGYFMSFNKQKKAILYNSEAKNQWHNIKCDYYGRFVDVTGKIIDESVYEKNKDEAIMKIGQEEKKESKHEARWKEKYARTLYVICEEKKIMPASKLAKLIGVTDVEVQTMVRRQKPEIILKNAGEAVI